MQSNVIFDIHFFFIIRTYCTDFAELFKFVSISPGFDTTGESISPGFDTTGESISPGFDTTGESISPGFDTTGESISPGFDTTGESISGPAPLSHS